jgi:hydroxymethylpyrimidine/phosphomethylpyrimidine kinase
MTPRIAMTIAGSDSGGGAGIEADLRAFAAYRVHGTVSITAITAQSTVGVVAVAALEPEMVVTQIETVLADIEVHAAKTGMLARPATIAAVGALAAAGALPPLVVDPVLVSSTGHPLMEAGGAEAYRELLIPFAEIVTPNLRETAVLLDVDVRELDTLAAMTDAGRALIALGATYALIKGGHFLEHAATSSRAPDVLVGPHDVIELDAVRIDTLNDHGTGCSTAASIAAGLARGLTTVEAVTTAKSFIHDAIVGARHWTIGHGHGPIDHLGWGDGGPSAPLP